MTISELTLKSRREPVRRFEVFTGTGRRREWPPEEKARIVAESYEAGETVSAVARRYGLTPQQLFAWRRAGAPSCCGDDELRILVRAGSGCSADAGAGGEASRGHEGRRRPATPA